MDLPETRNGEKLLINTYRYPLSCVKCFCRKLSVIRAFSFGPSPLSCSRIFRIILTVMKSDDYFLSSVGQFFF